VRCCCGYDDFFNARMARHDAARYRKRGLRRSARQIVEVARVRGLGGAEVLEVGGGVAALSLELIRAGAARATTIELSAAYEEEGTALAAEAGLRERVERRIGDVVNAGDDIAPADVVVLERVVCCYPDAEALVGAAGARARGLLVLSYPRYGLAARAVTRLVNVVLRLRRCAFRTYAHSPEAIRGAAAAVGLQRVAPERGLVWRVAAFERV
jgi:2-polyprenyl-3-methyl-5-hydroxy-6-metoxy-1,4-benzoquinol methylase